MIQIMDEVLQEEEFLIACRRYLHIHPELSDREDNTVRFILEKLNERGIRCEEVPGGGVMGYIEGNGPGKSLILRADIDALSIQESPHNEGGQPKCCVSENEGVCHACGHDCHTAMLLASSAVLQRNRHLFSGRIILYFERGEECGNGDRYMMEYIKKNNLKVDGAWALHVKASMESGTVSYTSGGVYAAGIGWSIELHRQEGSLVSPIEAASHVIGNLQNVRHRVFSPFEALTVSPCRLVGDENMCRVGGTCRFLERERIGYPVQEELRLVLECTAEQYGYFTDHIKVSGPGTPVVNHPVCCELASKSSASVLGEKAVVKGTPSMGCESFRVLSSRYPSVIGCLGVRNAAEGKTAELHNSRFDPDEKALVSGCAATVAYAFAFLSYEGSFEQKEEGEM